MRPFPSSDSGSELGLPPEVQRLLLDVVADGFVLYCCGPRTEPHALVACYEWPECIDLITIRDFARVTAARVPKQGTVDVFAPDTVVWAYEGPPQWTRRCSTWFTQHTPTPRPPPTRRHAPCTSPGLSNAR
ncbi:MAG: hypothetical protein ACRDTE_22100 [Pseudonocardiaceae bacterium]